MITIITSTYKSERYLIYFLKKAEQLHKELTVNNIVFEHILISNDTSENELFLINKSGLNFKLTRVDRESLYTSWNRGIKLSKYEYITFWNVDDDRFIEPFLELKEKQSSSPSLMYFPFIYRRYISFLNISIPVKKYLVTPPTFEKSRFTKEMHIGPFFIFNKNICDEIGMFDESFKIVGDFEFNVRTAKKFNFTQGTSVSGIFNSYGTGLSTNSRDANMEELSRIQNENNSPITR